MYRSPFTDHCEKTTPFKKKGNWRAGFVVWTIGNVLWIAVNLIGTPNIAQIVMFAAYALLNIDGLRRWKGGQK